MFSGEGDPEVAEVLFNLSAVVGAQEGRLGETEALLHRCLGAQKMLHGSGESRCFGDGFVIFCYILLYFVTVCYVLVLFCCEIPGKNYTRVECRPYIFLFCSFGRGLGCVGLVMTVVVVVFVVVARKAVEPMSLIPKKQNAQ